MSSVLLEIRLGPCGGKRGPILNYILLLCSCMLIGARSVLRLKRRIGPRPCSQGIGETVT